MEFTRHVLACLIALLILAAGGRIEAAETAGSAWAETQHGAVRLVSAVTGTGSAGTMLLGLEFRMEPGWHIYWRSPGDAGFPPQADWYRSNNLAAAVLSWPAPHRLSVLDLETIGYSDRVILPVEARLLDPAQPLALHATVDYLTCADICVPYVAELTLHVPAGPAIPSPFAHDIARAKAQVPGGAGVPSRLLVERVSIENSKAGATLAVSIRADEPLASPDIFAEGPSPLVFGAPRATFASDRRSAVLRVGIGNIDGLSRPIEGLPVTVTVVDGEQAVEHAATVSVGGQSPEHAASADIGMMLLLALLGGLILNLMPCVLPVLSMKLLAVVGHGGGDRRSVRAGFVATALGILFSFMVLAASLIVLQAAGAAVGWGLQFQQPWFLIAMILVVSLFAGNLWGLFEVPLPRTFAAASERAFQVGGQAGHFLTGALATLLATPCSAPFLGTAIGFALARGPGEIVLVFAAVALGLALPYLCVAAFPGLAIRLPKPGPWMRTLRRALGLALAGTAVWLGWVLAGSLGWGATLSVVAIACAVVFLFAARNQLPDRLRPFGVAGAGLLAGAAFLVPAFSALAPPTTTAGSEVEATLWQPFEPARIPALVAAGKVVWVNVTADWCLTCKVNEQFVLSRDPVRARLSGSSVVAMRGDWTRPDDLIVRYLAGFNRYGIPFDAVYGPALSTGEALPELLTEKAALTALDRAGGSIKAAVR